MSIVLVGPNQIMGLGNGRVGLLSPLDSANASATPPDPGIPLDTISGIAGWWDASSLADLVGSDSAPVTAWRSPVSQVQSRFTSGPALTSWSFNSTGRLPAAHAHLSGSLGGLGQVVTSSGTLSPCLDPDQGFRVANIGFPAGSAWTWFLVWSRPNRRQASGRDSDPITLASWNGLPILQADSTGASARLTLFPGSAPVVLTSALDRRHTHSVIIRYAPSAGVDVWLDDMRVTTGAINPMPTTPAGQTLLLHSGQFMGSAQCWFHEAAAWSTAISDQNVSTLLGRASRWVRGTRKGLLLVINGQSNALNYALNDGAADLLAQGVRWHLGALASNILATSGNPSSYTMQSGHGLYAAVGGAYPGSFVTDPQNGTPADQWALGADGLAVQAAIQGLSVEDRDDLCALVWPWNETDSLRNADELTTFSAAARRFLTLERAMAGKPAAQLPLIWWSAIPYGTDAGTAMHRRAVLSLAQDHANNITIGNPQTTDTNPRGSAWDEASGIATGGDSSHRDTEDNRRLARLAAPVVARSLLGSGYGDSVTTLPATIPASGGPRIVHAYRQSSTQIVVTVQHDAGNDLVIPRQAAVGKGFTVSDGDMAAGSGRLVPATACQRQNATQLLLTLSQPLQNGSGACALHYPYGGGSIGRGNAVTDNTSARPRDAGWEIEAQLGSSWTLDYPLATTMVPLTLADTPYAGA